MTAALPPIRDAGLLPASAWRAAQGGAPAQGFQGSLGTRRYPQPTTGEGGLGKGARFLGSVGGLQIEGAGTRDLRPTSFFGTHRCSHAPSPRGGARPPGATWVEGGNTASGICQPLVLREPWNNRQSSSRPQATDSGQARVTSLIPVCWAQRMLLFERPRMKRPRPQAAFVLFGGTDPPCLRLPQEQKLCRGKPSKGTCSLEWVGSCRPPRPTTSILGAGARATGRSSVKAAYFSKMDQSLFLNLLMTMAI